MRGRSCPTRVRRELELHAQSGEERNVVPRLRIAAANEWLKARDVVAYLEPDADDARARIDANGAVAVEVRLRIDRRVAIRVRASAEARADERRDQRREVRSPRSRFDAEVILIRVDFPGPRLKLVFRRRPAEGANHGEVLVGRPRRLRTDENRVLQKIPLISGRKIRADERTNRDMWLRAGRRLRGKAARREQQPERRDQSDGLRANHGEGVIKSLEHTRAS